MTGQGPQELRLKRVYAPPAPEDGARVLVDRLWPRGLRKADARIDLWLKEIAPSPALRKWFGHDPEKWPEFQQRYREELENNPPAVRQLRGLVEQGLVTLLFATRDERRNSAVLLKEFLEEKG